MIFDKISSISGRGAEKTAKSTVSGAPGAAKMVEIHEIFMNFHEFPWKSNGIFHWKQGGRPISIYILFGASRGSPWGTRIGPESDKIGPKSDKFRQKSRMLVFPKEFQWLSPPGGAPWALSGPTLTGFGPILGRLGWPRTIDFPKENQWFRKIVKILIKFQENFMDFRSKCEKCKRAMNYYCFGASPKEQKSEIFLKFMKL